MYERALRITDAPQADRIEVLPHRVKRGIPRVIERVGKNYREAFAELFCSPKRFELLTQIKQQSAIADFGGNSISRNELHVPEHPIASLQCRVGREIRVMQA